jgi:uncharacterized membrane protein YgcG
MIKPKIQLLFGLLLLSIVPSILQPPIVQADTSDFTINSFTADYYLSRDTQKTSQLKVEEVIQAEFPNTNQNRGILRTIPNSYQNHTVSLQIEKVTDALGNPYRYTTESQNDNTILRIGDPNEYVQGIKTYLINYSMRNVINFQDIDELYWDVNGDQWQQPFTSITARIHVPRELGESLTGQQKCFTGAFRSKASNCVITSGASNSETMITVQGNNLNATENLSFVLGFNKGTFTEGPEVKAEKRELLFILIASIICILGLPLITLIVMTLRWLKTGRDPKGRGVIIPEYIAPKGLNVMNSGFILRQKLEPKMISAGLIQIAIDGYVQLSEIEKKNLIGSSKDYELKIIKDIRSLSKEQQTILDAFFSSTEVGSTAKVSDQKNKLFTVLSSVNKYLAENLTTNEYFTYNPEKTKQKYYLIAIILFVVSLIVFLVIPLGIGLFLSSVIVFVFSKMMPARSQKGVELKDYLLGLKEYIKLAEADRLKYLQSPQGAEKTPIDPNNPKQLVKLFEDLLPYAILFGLEKEWAEQFKNLYTQPPSWYSGNMNTFSAVTLANSMSSFSSANNNAFSAPSSSGSSGFSSGGGFSGGGGGGGGGGGW